MNQEPLADLFEITLSQEGANHLLRLNKINRWLLVFCIIANLIVLSDTFIRFKLYRRYYTAKTWETFIMTNIHPVFVVIMIVLTMLQAYYFFYFSQKSRKSIQEHHPQDFNAAFIWLIRGSLMSIITLLLNIIGGAYFMYVDYVSLHHSYR